MDETHVESGSAIALYLLPSILGVLKNKKNKIKQLFVLRFLKMQNKITIGFSFWKFWNQRNPSSRFSKKSQIKIIANFYEKFEKPNWEKWFLKELLISKIGRATKTMDHVVFWRLNNRSMLGENKCLVSNIECSRLMKIHCMWKLSQLNKDISHVNKVMTMLEKGSINLKVIKEIVSRKFYKFAFIWKHGS